MKSLASEVGVKTVKTRLLYTLHRTVCKRKEITVSKKWNILGHHTISARQGERIHKEMKKEWTEVRAENEVTVRCQPMG